MGHKASPYGKFGAGTAFLIVPPTPCRRGRIVWSVKGTLVSDQVVTIIRNGDRVQNLGPVVAASAMAVPDRYRSQNRWGK